MKTEILKIEGNINDFIGGKLDGQLQSIGYGNLTVEETEEFNGLIQKALGLLRKAIIRELLGGQTGIEKAYEDFEKKLNQNK